uniref:Uncharacterized protein n=1 Tax=Ixodes ricinus TaxID=34613 RepID=A0A6B0UEZ8_IXORI
MLRDTFGVFGTFSLVSPAVAVGGIVCFLTGVKWRRSLLLPRHASHSETNSFASRLKVSRCVVVLRLANLILRRFVVPTFPHRSE